MTPGAGAASLRGVPYSPVPDVVRIGTFYEDVFGFLGDVAGNPPEFAGISPGGTHSITRVHCCSTIN